mmetsp:Transcript_19866/g.60192  ORF Transcript_19866/g.60192 Transcript_19866/m.60192 type:complete len:250 (-) Transcript_19866:1014-1763(-)
MRSKDWPTSPAFMSQATSRQRLTWPARPGAGPGPGDRGCALGPVLCRVTPRSTGTATPTRLGLSSSLSMRCPRLEKPSLALEVSSSRLRRRLLVCSWISRSCRTASTPDAATSESAKGSPPVASFVVPSESVPLRRPPSPPRPRPPLLVFQGLGRRRRSRALPTSACNSMLALRCGASASWMTSASFSSSFVSSAAASVAGPSPGASASAPSPLGRIISSGLTPSSPGASCDAPSWSFCASSSASSASW